MKRIIGCQYADKEVQTEIKTCLHEIINENGKPKIKVNFRDEDLTFTPEQISAMLLKHIKENAEKHFINKTVCKAVITVPAQFKENQRQATKDAGRIAGLEVMRIINEPTAAAMAYGLDKKFENDSRSRNILVYDFGGGTFDVSIITIDDGVLDVKTTNGDTHLGGNDITESLVKYFTHIWEQYHPDANLRGNSRALRRLRVQCEQLKKRLSDKYSAELEIDRLINDRSIHKTISRNEFENLITDKVEKTLMYVDNTLKDATLNKNQIDEVILVGGSTRIPLVRNMVKTFFNGKNLNYSLNPDEAVAIGAAVQASILDDADGETSGTLLLLDITSLSLGIETSGGVFTPLIPRNTQIPFKKMKQFSNEKDNQTKVKILVYEGERKFVEHNNKLGEFTLSNITPRPRGKTHINVTFGVDTDGILTVTAEEQSDENKGNEIIVQVNKSNLSESEIVKMIQVAQRFEEEDQIRKSIFTAKLSLSNLCDDFKNKANINVTNKGDKEKILEMCNETLDWIENTQVENKEAYELKKTEVNRIFRQIYSQYI